MHLMGFKVIWMVFNEFCHGFSMSMCVWMHEMHWLRFHGFWTLFWGFELLSSLKTVFWDFKSFEDSSGSVRRKRVPQVRAREDNPSGCWGSPDLVKTVLIWVLNRWVLWKENRILVFMRQYGFSRSPCVGMLFRKFEHVGVTDMFIVDVWLCRKWF